MTQNEKFIVSVYVPAYARLRSLGKNSKDADRFARLIVSEAIQESGWGTKTSGKNNYFGIKAMPNQQGTLVATHEGYGASRIAITDKFADYDTTEEGINAAVDMLKNKFHAFDGPATVEAFVDSIKKYGYFTDSRETYLKGIKSILEGPTMAGALAKDKSGLYPSIPQPLMPPIVNPNDATMVDKPIVVPRYRIGCKLITLETIRRIKELVRRIKQNMNYQQ